MPLAAQVAGVRAAGDGGALPRAVARRAGGVRRHALVPRAHQAQLQAVWVLTPCLGTPPHRSAQPGLLGRALGALHALERGAPAPLMAAKLMGCPCASARHTHPEGDSDRLPARPWLGGCGRGVLWSASLVSCKLMNGTRIHCARSSPLSSPCACPRATRDRHETECIISYAAPWRRAPWRLGPSSPPCQGEAA